MESLLHHNYTIKERVADLRTLLCFSTTLILIYKKNTIKSGVLT